MSFCRPSRCWSFSGCTLRTITSLKYTMTFSTQTGEATTTISVNRRRRHAYMFFSSRREMMPILSLIFSALFILFGTVIIQAFRSEGLGPRFNWRYLNCIHCHFCHLGYCCTFRTLMDLEIVFLVSQLRANQGSQSQKSSHKLRPMLQAEQALQGSVTWIHSPLHQPAF